MDLKSVTQEKVGIPGAVQSDKLLDLSAIIAVRNMENDIQEYYRSLKSTLDQVTSSYEIIFIDDASDDQTYAQMIALSHSDARLRLIKMRSPFGESSAFEAGFKLSRGEKIIFYTARVRPDATQLPALLAKLDEGFDLVVGWRYPRRDYAINQIISRAFNFIVDRMSNLRLHDVNSGILVTRRDVLDNLQIYGGLNRFIPVIAQKQGYKITEEKIAQLSGSFRKSWFVSEYLNRLLDILTVIFLTKYSKKPIHFLGFMGGICMVVGGIIDLYLFFYRILGFGPIAGRPLLLLGALLLVIGIQMVAMGLIGEMIIFTHAGDIKDYNIEEILE
ncbi:glycosyltransferase [candidate division KSB1 bacterium]|nr:glycosyltransferase [candidate division KSB1 bacterium]